LSNRKYEQETDVTKKETIRAELSAFGRKHRQWEKSYLDSLLATHPNMVATAYLLNYYKMFERDIKAETLRDLYGKLTGAAKTSVYAQQIKKELDVKLALQPGKLAPHFKALHPDSTEF